MHRCPPLPCSLHRRRPPHTRPGPADGCRGATARPGAAPPSRSWTIAAMRPPSPRLPSPPPGPVPHSLHPPPLTASTLEGGGRPRSAAPGASRASPPAPFCRPPSPPPGAPPPPLHVPSSTRSGSGRVMRAPSGRAQNCDAARDRVTPAVCVWMPCLDPMPARCSCWVCRRETWSPTL